MKKMSLKAAKEANGGSVRCDICGWTTWGVSSMESHQKSSHRRMVPRYTWYVKGPCSGYTRPGQHWGIIKVVR